MKKKAAIRLFIAWGSVIVAFMVLTAFSAARAGSVMATRNIVVKPGDTLWRIASEYGAPNKDVREVIYTIRQLNGLPNSDILPGQVLKIPAR